MFRVSKLCKSDEEAAAHQDSLYERYTEVKLVFVSGELYVWECNP